MTGLEFRRAGPGDVPLLAKMNQQLIRDTGHRNPMSLPELEARMASWLEAEYQAFLFLRKATLVGYVLFRPGDSWLYLRQFFVLPEFRRQGIARAAVAWLRSNAWGTDRRLRIEVLVHNKTAISFWRAVGFNDYAITMELEGGES